MKYKIEKLNKNVPNINPDRRFCSNCGGAILGIRHIDWMVIHSRPYKLIHKKCRKITNPMEFEEQLVTGDSGNVRRTGYLRLK